MRSHLVALLALCGFNAAHLDAQVATTSTKIVPEAPAFYPPVAPTPADIAEAWGSDPKQDGNLVISSLNLNTPLSRDPLAPNWSIYRGIRVPMTLRAAEFAVRMTVKTDAASVLANLSAAGVSAKQATDTGLTHDWIIELAQPMKDERQMNALLQIALQAPGVSFAAPCFNDPFGHGQRLYPTPDIMAAFAGDAQATAASLAPDAAVVDPNFGMIDGALLLRTPQRNGFAVMALANALAAHPAARFAECDFRFVGTLHTIPNDPFFNQQFHLRQNAATPVDYRAYRAWNYATGTGIRVLVMDSGTQQNHPDINQLTGRNFVDAPAAGNGDGAPVGTCDDHGTPVSGTISARFGNSLGVAGVAPNSRTLSARIGLQTSNPCASAFASFQWSWMVNALAWGRAQGCRVTNASLGGGGPSAALETAYQQAYEAGQIHFVSAGNDGVGTIDYPASAAFVNAVGGISPAGMRIFNYGPGIAFTGLASSVATTDRTGAPGYSASDYTAVSGTSFSSPGCAGVAALVLSAHPTLTSAQLEFRLRTSATDWGTPGYDTSFGYGVPSAYAAITLLAPSNDACEVCIEFTSFNYSTTQSVFNATESTEDPQEPCEFNNAGVSHSVFYIFQAPVAGTLNISTAGSSYDTVLSVYTFCQGYSPITDNISSPAPAVACNDDEPGALTSFLAQPLSVGDIILIKVSRYGSAPATNPSDCNLVFNTVFTPVVPDNNKCFQATNWPASAPFITSNNTYAADPAACAGDTPAGCAASGKPLWYRWTAPADGYARFDTLGSDFDTVLSIHGGCPRLFYTAFGQPPECVPAAVLGCSDDAIGTAQSNVGPIEVRAGTAYLVRAAGYRNTASGVTASGALRINVEFVAADLSTPANDDCNTAFIIPGDQPAHAITGHSTTTATTPELCGDPAWAPGGAVPHGRTVWWSFTPVNNGAISFDTVGSNFDTVLSLYDGSLGCTRDTGSGCFQPTVLAGNDDFDFPASGRTSRIEGYPVTAATTYLIRISSYADSAGGLAALNFTYTPDTTPPPPPANDTCDTAIVIPSDTITYVASPIDTRNASGGDPCSDLMWDCTTGELTGALAERSVFFTYTPAVLGRIAIDTFGSTYDTRLDLITAITPCGTYDEDTGLCDGLYISACNDDAAPGVPQAAMDSLIVEPGYTLHIRISAAPGSLGGTALFSLTFTPEYVAPPACAADLGTQGGLPGHDGLLDNNDFIAFIDYFFNENHRADLGEQGGLSGSDGLFDNNDFIVFIDQFFAGC